MQISPTHIAGSLLLANSKLVSLFNTILDKTTVYSESINDRKSKLSA